MKKKELKYLLFIVPLYIALVMGACNMRTMFPCFFLFFAGCISLWAILNFRAIFKEQELYKYNKEDKHKAALAKDPCRFHFSMLYIMGGMLRTDERDTSDPTDRTEEQFRRQESKMRFMVRYIQEVIPEEYQSEAVDLFDYLTLRETVVTERKQKPVTYSVINKTAILNHKEKYYFDNLKDEENEVMFSIKFKDSEIGFVKQWFKGVIKHSIKDQEMAEELAKYIKKDDAIYIMYLLFKMSIYENKVFKPEIDKIKEVCVEGMHVSKAILNELIEAYKSSRLDEWYQTRLASEGRYPTPDKIADLYTKNNALHAKTDEIDTVPTSNHENIAILQRGEFFSACIMVVFYYFYVESHTSKWIIIFLSVITFICYYITSFKGPQLTEWKMLRTKSEDTKQKNDIEQNFILAALSSILCWITFLNIALVVADRAYTVREYDKECYISNAGEELIYNHKSSKPLHKYYIEFYPIKASDRDPSEVHHTISPAVKPLLNILPYISGYKLFGSPIWNEDISKIEVRETEYRRREDGASTVELHIQESYYGRVYVGSYKIKGPKDECTINGHEYIDLGLPSGTLWATCNVGANRSTDFGYLYAWGETGTKTEYSWDTYKYEADSYKTMHQGKGTETGCYKYTIPDNYYEKTTEPVMWYDLDNFVGDNLTKLEPEDDAATMNWGSEWRMPSLDETKELIEGCNWSLTDDFNHSGTGGLEGTSKTNGNTIFMPFPDSYHTTYHINSPEFWIRELSLTRSFTAYYFTSQSLPPSLGENPRCYGESIRAVVNK